MIKELQIPFVVNDLNVVVTIYFDPPIPISGYRTQTTIKSNPGYKVQVQVEEGKAFVNAVEIESVLKIKDMVRIVKSCFFDLEYFAGQDG